MPNTYKSFQKNGARQVLQRCVAGNGDGLKHGKLQVFYKEKTII